MASVWEEIREARKLLKGAGFPVTRVSIKLDDKSWSGPDSDYGTLVIRHKGWRKTATLETGSDGYVYVKRGGDMSHIQISTSNIVEKVKAALARHKLVERLGITGHGSAKYVGE